MDVNASDLEDQLGLWQTFYNWHCPHTSLNGKTSIERFCELM